MATFSLGTSGITPGAPGVYINERAGLAGAPQLASFSTVYMLVETEENVPTTIFPFNTPVAVSSLNDYRVLNGGQIPTSRIPSLSYSCVEEFFNNAQVGDLRVVRVGTPNQIVEIEFFPSGSKTNTSSLPSALMAGNVVYVQMVINGLRLTSGVQDDFNLEYPGFTANDEYLGVPVRIPVNYVAGDEVNNRKIAAAISSAVAAAIESNPAVRAAVYVRDFGLVNDLDPLSNSQNSYITIANTTFDGNVSVVTQVFPVGANFVFMQNTYDVNNIVGGQSAIVRVPQDYTQCITTAFEGQQDQGYLITPTAYAQFDSTGRAYVGQIAALHCESNSYKWMALADPGPYLITDVNKYSEFQPHQAAADLITGMKYLIDNAIYQWTGADRTYDRLAYQAIVSGQSPQAAVTESANTVGSDVQVGLLDSGSYDLVTIGASVNGVFQITSSNFWPVNLPIQKVVLSGADAVTNPLHPYNGTEVYVIAPPYTPEVDATGSYPLNFVYLATTSQDATAVYNFVVAAGGTLAASTSPVSGSITAAGTGDSFSVAYADSFWNFPVTINGQTSNLIQNITNATVGVNTLHLPGTLQEPTETYRLGFVSRTILNPNTNPGGVSPAGSTGGVATLSSLQGGAGYVAGTYLAVPLVGLHGTGATADITVSPAGVVTSVVLVAAGSAYYVGDVLTAANANLGGSGSGFAITVASVVGGSTNKYTGALQFNVVSHGLVSGQKLYFTQPIIVNNTNVIKATTPNATNPYWVTVVDSDTFVVSNSLSNYTTQSFVKYVNGYYEPLPTVMYTDILVGGTTDITLQDVGQFPVIRGRKYAFDSSNVFNQASRSSAAPAVSAANIVPDQSIYFNTSAVVLGSGLISPYGETYDTAGWLPKLELPNPTTNPTPTIANAYCVPTVDQEFQAEAFMVPALGTIYGGDYDPTGTGTEGPLTLANISAAITTPGAGYTAGTYQNVELTGGVGRGAQATIVVAGGAVTTVTVTQAGWGYAVGDVLTVPAYQVGGSGTNFALTLTATELNLVASSGEVTTGAPAGSYAQAAGIGAGNTGNSVQAALESGAITGLTFEIVSNAGFAPDGTTAVVIGDTITAVYNGNTYSWQVTPAVAAGGDITTAGRVQYNSQIEMTFSAEEVVPAVLWRFDAITSTEIIDNALRGVGNGGEPEAVFVDAGVDNVNRLLDDSQRYANPFGFIAYYGPYIQNGAGKWIPPSPYVTGVAVRRYRSEGYQFPPAGVKYQLNDAIATQIPINSAQQNLLNPKGCNAIRTLPGYPQTAVFIWGGRTRLPNPNDAQQALYKFVNTRVILNVVYGSLRRAFDSQIFNVIDGFGIVFNQIILVGNAILNQLYVKGALFGATPDQAFQVICDSRINPPADLENGIVNAKVFVTPVPTLERIQIDLIRVAIGNMQNELDLQGLGQDNSF
jgi:hypothetical protein